LGDLERWLWAYLSAFSRVDQALHTVWQVVDSENHNAIQHSSSYMIADAISRYGSIYGSNSRLADGHRVIDHVTAWQRYWKEYFRQRAREGIDIEIASSIYAKYSVQTYYNLSDLPHSGVVRRLARTFLDLVWIDIAHETLPNGVRGGAATRVYKDAYLTRGARDGLRILKYTYDWHDTFEGTNPSNVVAASCAYQPPAVLRDFVRQAKQSYLYVSRRPGHGLNREHSPTGYDVLFPSKIRRETWVTPDYVMGTFAIDQNHEYTLLNTQNRSMGVVFADGVDSRIVVHGRGYYVPSDPAKKVDCYLHPRFVPDPDPEVREEGGCCKSETASCRTGFAEVLGITGQDTLIAWRDTMAEHSIGTRIYISEDIWRSMNIVNGYPAVESGWMFGETPSAFVAIRVVSGGVVRHSVNAGRMLEFQDQWSPVIIQTGRRAQYGNLNTFKAAIAQTLFYASGRWAVYENPAGQRFVVRGYSSGLPYVCDPTCHYIDLEPTLTYDSPFLRGPYGDQVFFEYDGYSRVLDFGY
jgi:hypothetical protein